MPATYLPHLFMLKLPEIMLALGLTGLSAPSSPRRVARTPVNRRAGLLVVALAAVSADRTRHGGAAGAL